MDYSVQPRIFVKGYWFLSFAKNMAKNIGKNISKDLSGECSQKLIGHIEKKAAGALKTASKRAIHKKSQATVDLIGSKIANRITKVSKTLQQNNSEKNTNENGKELPKERYVSLEERQKIIDDLRLI